MSTVEPYTVVNSTAGNSAPVGGKRKSLKLVTKKRARKVLKKLGMKMRGGAETAPVAVPKDDLKAADAVTAGRRHRTRRHKKRSLFGMKY